MATVLMVIADVLAHEPDEMSFAEDHDVLEQLATTTQDPTLGGAVLPRASKGRAD